jgi:hypothetical protein
LAIYQLAIIVATLTRFSVPLHLRPQEAPTRIPFGPPPPLEEFDDTADKGNTNDSGSRNGIGVFQRSTRTIGQINLGFVLYP